MKLIVPSYYKDFRCIGGSCSDNCCIGWEIDIDESTLERYRKTDGDLGRKFKENISEDGSPHFILRGERCPFLNSDNLCDIITERGEGYLCDICREHPRYYTTLGDTVFGGVGICCEAAARLVLSENEHKYLTLETSGEREECDGELLSAMLDFREKIIEKTKNKTENIVYTLRGVLSLAKRVQSKLDGEDKSSYISRGNRENGDVLTVFEKMEYMSDEMPRLLRASRHRKAATAQSETVNIYLHNLFAYFIDRYLPKAVEDGYILGKVTIAVVSTLALFHIFENEENLTLDRAVYLAKLYSKEVEYNEENVEKLEEMSEDIINRI